jgi:membrane-bound inhibitor of C-type lysozyme
MLSPLDQTVTGEATYRCADAKTVRVMFQDDVNLQLSDGRDLTLPYRDTASFAQEAAAGGFAFRGKGKAANIIENGTETYANCSAKTPAFGNNVWTYHCDGGKTIRATYLNSMQMLMGDDQVFVAPQVVSANGSRYASAHGAFEFWIVGNRAHLKLGPATQQCTALPNK